MSTGFLVSERFFQGTFFSGVWHKVQSTYLLVIKVYQLAVLPDIQGEEDSRGVCLESVGITSLRFPLTVKMAQGGRQTTVATFRMGVYLTAEAKGTHMSRFVEVLQEEVGAEPFHLGSLRTLLVKLCDKLESNRAEIKVNYPIFLDHAAPVTGVTAPMPYEVSIEGSLSKSISSAELKTTLDLCVPVSNACPCSKAISQAGAHNQRAIINTKLYLNSRHVERGEIWPEEFIEELLNCGSARLYPLLKRVDEKFVTESQYSNPKFVEDIARDATIALRNCRGLTGYEVYVEAHESIHIHNAFAYHKE